MVGDRIAWKKYISVYFVRASRASITALQPSGMQEINLSVYPWQVSWYQTLLTFYCNWTIVAGFFLRYFRTYYMPNIFKRIKILNAVRQVQNLNTISFQIIFRLKSINEKKALFMMLVTLRQQNNSNCTIKSHKSYLEFIYWFCHMRGCWIILKNTSLCIPQIISNSLL